MKLINRVWSFAMALVMVLGLMPVYAAASQGLCAVGAAAQSNVLLASTVPAPTGDNANLVLWIILLLGSAAGVIILMASTDKKRRK